MYRGAALNVNGELDNEVIFQGDRLEAEFDDIAGQWDRVWINTGAASNIKYAHIKNGFVGLQVEPLPFDDFQDVVPEKSNGPKNNDFQHGGYRCLSAQCKF